MARVGRAASQPTHPATLVETTEMSAVATPSTVAGATNGAANRFATTPTTDTELCSSTITGAHISCAATGTAKAGPQPRIRIGSSRPTAAPHGPAKSSSPKVASVESEARGPGQPRVPDQQHEDGHREGGKSRSTTRGTQAEQPYRAHGGRTDDARLRPDEDDEREQQHGRE